jgi:N-methylhydantoinase A
MRYRGQGHEIVVPLPNRPLVGDDAVTLQEAFDRVYASLYKRLLPNAEVEILTWLLTISTVPDVPDRPPPPAAAGAADPASTRFVYDAERGEAVTVPLYWRPDLAPGMLISGPAVVAENETSTFIPAAYEARITSNRHIVIDRRAE